MNFKNISRFALAPLLTVTASASITLSYNGTDAEGAGGYTRPIFTGAGQTISDDTGGGGITVTDAGSGKTVLGLEAPAAATDMSGQPYGPWSYSINAHSITGTGAMFGFNSNTPGASFYFIFLANVGGNLQASYQTAPGAVQATSSQSNTDFDSFLTTVDLSVAHVFTLEYTNGVNGIYDGALGQADVGSSNANDDVVNFSIDGVIQGQVYARLDSPALTNQVFFGSDASSSLGTITVTEATAVFATVPEPSSAILAGLGCLGLLFRRNR